MLDNSENNPQAPDTDNPDTTDTALSDLQGKHDRLKQQADGSHQEATKNFDVISALVGKDNKLLDSIKESNPKLASKISDKLGIRPEPKDGDDEYYDEEELFTKWEARQEGKKSVKALEDMLSVYSDEDKKTIDKEYKEIVWEKVIWPDKMKTLVGMIAKSLNKEAIRDNALANMASGNFNNAWIPITKPWKAKSKEDLSQEAKDLAKTLWWKI